MNKKAFIKIAISLVLIMTLSACSVMPKVDMNELSKEAAENNKTVDEANKVQDNDIEKLKKIYSDILSTMNYKKFYPEDEYADDEVASHCSYTYSLVKVNNIDYPLLLVAQDYDYGTSDIKFYYANKDFTKEITSEKTIGVGIAEVGGFRGSLSLKDDGSSLIYSYFFSGTGEACIEDVNINTDGNTLNVLNKTSWEGNFDDMPEVKSINIDFLDISDQSELDNLDFYLKN